MRAAALSVLVALAQPLSGASLNPPSVASPILDPDREGLELAIRLRSAAPSENSEFAGLLEIISREGTVRSVPIDSRLTVTPTTWLVVYRSAPTSQAPAETLTITHTPGQENTYTLAIGTNQLVPITLNTRPFAGSDFWLIDLGLGFFHWPRQRAIRSEMSRGQPCRVLESTDPNPAPGSYSRVLSWVDLETGGIIQAEAYDTQNKLLKKFAIGPVMKVQGQWRLREMRIRNTQTKRQTELKFDLKGK